MLMTFYQQNMTQAMLDEWNATDAQMADEIAMCIERANAAAEAAEVALPATAVSGESVLHGARKATLRVMDYWIARLVAAFELIGVDATRRIVRSTALHPSVERLVGGI